MNRLGFEGNIFRIFMSLWYLSPVKISKNPWGKGDIPWMIWHGIIQRSIFFLLATVAMITVKISFTHFHRTIFRETHSFMKIIQPISPNYNRKYRVKQIMIIEEKSSQSFILCQLLRTKTLASGSKSIKHYFWIFTTICLMSAE